MGYDYNNYKKNDNYKKKDKKVEQKGILDFYKEFNAPSHYHKKKKQGFISLLGAGASNGLKLFKFGKACKEYYKAYDENLQKIKHQQVQEELRKINIQEKAEKVMKQQERNAAKMNNPNYRKMVEEIDVNLYQELYHTKMKSGKAVENYKELTEEEVATIGMWRR